MCDCSRVSGKRKRAFASNRKFVLDYWKKKLYRQKKKNLHKEIQKIKLKGNSIKVLQKWKNNMPVKDLRIWLVVCNLFYYQI